MSVVESTHEQSLVTEASVVFFPMNMLKSYLFLVMLGYGEMDLSFGCNDPHTMMVRVKYFLLLLNKYRMIEKNTVLSIKKEEIYRLCI